MVKALWFTRLKEGVSPDDYRHFVRSVDYPAAARIPSIASYLSVYIQGPLMGGETPPGNQTLPGNRTLPYHFLDIAEVNDVDAYRQDLESHPAAQEVHGQSGQYVEVVGSLLVELIAP